MFCVALLIPNLSRPFGGIPSADRWRFPNRLLWGASGRHHRGPSPRRHVPRFQGMEGLPRRFPRDGGPNGQDAPSVLPLLLLTAELTPLDRTALGARPGPSGRWDHGSVRHRASISRPSSITVTEIQGWTGARRRPSGQGRTAPPGSAAALVPPRAARFAPEPPAKRPSEAARFGTRRATSLPSGAAEEGRVMTVRTMTP
jgi:hypothetical protein